MIEHNITQNNITFRNFRIMCMYRSFNIFVETTEIRWYNDTTNPRDGYIFAQITFFELLVDAYNNNTFHVYQIIKMIYIYILRSTTPICRNLGWCAYRSTWSWSYDFFRLQKIIVGICDPQQNNIKYCNSDIIYSVLYIIHHRWICY